MYMFPRRQILHHALVTGSATSSSESGVDPADPPPPRPLYGIFGNKISPSSQRGKVITNAISKFIVKDLRPYSVVENAGFKNLVQVLEPKYKIPSRQYFSDSAIPEENNKICGVVKRELHGCYAAITTDGWTSRATDSYITITCSCIANDWAIKNYVLQTRAMPEQHTGVNIAAVLKEATVEWGLQPDIPIVSDNAANMIVAGKEFGTMLHVPCFAHTLNLACTKALKINSVAKFLAKMRAIVGYFHRSPHAMAVLKDKQKMLQLPEHKLVIDVQTRWNSALDMVSRFLEQQPAIYSALTSKELRGKVNLNALIESDISEAEELEKILTSLKVATVALCEEAVPTVSLILPLQHQLLSFMAAKEDDTNLITQVKKAVHDDLSIRYINIKDKLSITSLIDPRFKLVPFLSDGERLEAYHSLTIEAIAESSKQISATVKPEPGTSDDLTELPSLPQLDSTHILTTYSDDLPGPSPKKPKLEEPQPEVIEKPSAMSSLFGDVYITAVEKPKSAQELIEAEIQTYKNEPPINASDNPLIWWKQRETVFPKLSCVAKKYLCIPSTSVPSERVFSTAGDIVTAQRSQLKPEHVDMLVFLKKNWNI